MYSISSFRLAINNFGSIHIPSTPHLPSISVAQSPSSGTGPAKCSSPTLIAPSDCEHPLHSWICAFVSNHLCWCSSCSSSLSSSVRAFHNSNSQPNPCSCPCSCPRPVRASPTSVSVCSIASIVEPGRPLRPTLALLRSFSQAEFTSPSPSWRLMED